MTLDEATLKLLYEFTTRRLTLLYEMYSNLNRKILELFKLFASFTPILLGIGYYLLTVRFTQASFILLIESALLYLFTIGYCLMSILPREPYLSIPLDAYKVCRELGVVDALDSLTNATGEDWDNLLESKIEKSNDLRKMSWLIFATLCLMFTSYVSLLLCR